MAEKPLEIYRDYPDNEAGDIRLASGMIFREMQLLNVLIIFLLTVVTVHAQRGYIHNGTALTFLVNSGRIPVLFWKMPVCVMFLVLCLLAHFIESDFDGLGNQRHFALVSFAQ